MIQETKDGSATIYSQQFDETYHSISGAIQEANHVFIDAGFKFCTKKEITIFEVGFGTGLNAFLTYIEAEKQAVNINYITIEKYPIKQEFVEKLNYYTFFEKKYKEIFHKIHAVEWGSDVKISQFFSIKKINADLIKYNFEKRIDLVYFDAFSYNSQPEIWSIDVFEKLYKAMNNNSIIVTYSAKGIIKQNIRTAGFIIKRLKGAAGKWHMLRATKF